MTVFQIAIMSSVVAVASFLYLWKRRKMSQKKCTKCTTVKVKHPKDIQVGDYIKFVRTKWFLDYELHALVLEVAAGQDKNRIDNVKLIYVQFPFLGEWTSKKEIWQKYDQESSYLCVLRYPNSKLPPLERIARIRCVPNPRMTLQTNESISKMRKEREHFLEQCYEPPTYCCGHFNTNQGSKRLLNPSDEPSYMCRVEPEVDFSFDTGSKENAKVITLDHNPLLREYIELPLNLPLKEFVQDCSICCKHHIRAKYVLSAEMTTLVKDFRDYKVGDIISFYTHLKYICPNMILKSKRPQYGVVVQINLTNPNNCQVVHYDRDKEQLIQTNYRIRPWYPYETKVINYDESKIIVNPADMVCHRALCRVGETFQELENEFYFTRWCKLSDNQPFVEISSITPYINMLFMKIAIPWRRFIHVLFSKPNIGTVRTVRSIVMENDYTIGDVILFEQFQNDQAIDIGIVVEIANNGQKCNVVYLNNRDRKVALQEVTVRMGCTDVMNFEKSVFFLNPVEEVHKRAYEKLGETCSNLNSYSFISYCKLQKDQPRSFLVICTAILYLFWKLVHFSVKSKSFQLYGILIYLLFGKFVALTVLSIFVLDTLVKGNSKPLIFSCVAMGLFIYFLQRSHREKMQMF